MLVGIKYCGGCNSGYDRVKFVEQLKAELPEIDFCSVERNKRVDYMIVVCGCPKTCADTTGIYSDYGYMTIPSLSYAEDVVKSISEAAEKYEKARGEKRKIEIGHSVKSRKTMTEAAVVLFTELTEDYNKIYTDNELAEKAGVPRKLIPARLVSDYISALMSTVFPGDGTILSEEKTVYHEHVFVGDVLSSEIKFVACKEVRDIYLGEFKVLCTNQHNHIVLEYEAVRQMPKALFEPV